MARIRMYDCDWDSRHCNDETEWSSLSECLHDLTQGLKHNNDSLSYLPWTILNYDPEENVRDMEVLQVVTSVTVEPVLQYGVQTSTAPTPETRTPEAPTLTANPDGGYSVS